MAEFVEVIKQRNRMCKFFKNCDKGCPLDSLKNDINMFCDDSIHKFPKEAEKIIMQWAKKNPVKTNRDKFKEVFGLKVTIDDWCIFADSDTCEAHSRCDDECEHYNFWDKEYIERNEE